MSGNVLLGLPIPLGSLTEVMARNATSGHLFLSITVTDPVDGPLSFLWSDSSFQSDNTPSGPRVYPVIQVWGPPRKMLTLDGETRDPDFEVQLDAAAECTPTNGTKAYLIYKLFQSTTIQGAEVVVFQWSEDSSTQIPIWRGYLSAVSQAFIQDDAMLITARFTGVGKPMLVKIGPIVGKDIYLTAPKESTGLMPPFVKGKLGVGMGASEAVNEAMLLGLRSQFSEGIRIAEDNGNAQLTYEYARNDGVKAAALSSVGAAGDPSVDCGFWIYATDADAFGMLDPAYFTPTNDLTSVRAVIRMDAKCWTSILPSGVGSDMHAGFVASAYKVTNDDPNDFLQTTATEYILAYNVPPLNFPGFTCTKATVMVDIEGDNLGSADTRTIIFGLANVTEPGGPQWWGGIANKATYVVNVGLGATPRQRIWMRSSYPAGGLMYYDATVAYGAHNLANINTVSNFYQGQFIGLDAGGNSVPIQLELQVSSASKDKVRIYGITVVLYGTPGLYGNRIQVGARNGFIPVPRTSWKQPGLVPTYDRQSFIDPSQPRAVAGIKFLWTGWGQKDHDVLFEGGASDAAIEKGSGMIHQLVRDMNPNISPGTVGNFVDARHEALAGEKAIRVAVGSTPQNYREHIDQMQKIHPFRFHDKNGTLGGVYEEMNPDASRQYRNSAEIVKIMGKDIERESFRYSSRATEDLVNAVRLNFGQGYESERPLGTTSYINRLSQMLYGAREEQAMDAPWVGIRDITSPFTPAPATYYARYLGRRAARPLLTVTCTLPQAYFDLECGHVTEFGSDMELYGFYCTAHRSGKVDYVLSNQTATSNAANNKTAEIVALTTDSTYLGFSQQTDMIAYAIGVAGAWTNVANPWLYSASEGGIGATIFDLTWNPYSNVVNPHGFKTLGPQSTSWDRPIPALWKKADILFGGGTFYTGPVYWARYQYAAASVHAVLSDVFTIAGGSGWPGRRFEVIEVSRKLGSYGDYPKVEVQLQEIP